MTNFIAMWYAMGMSLTMESYRQACRDNPTEENLRILNEYEQNILDWIKAQLPRREQ